MRVSIVGQGVVGQAMYDLLSGHYEVEFDSPDPCELGVIAVPTPSRSDGRADTSTVRYAAHSLNAEVILIKSTIPPGCTDSLKAETGKRIVMSPEYRGESAYFNPYFPEDMAEVPFVILGGDEADTAHVQEVLLPVLGPTKTYFRTTARNAECIKYAENNFFALKITFVNEMKQICDAVGADWHEVREGWLLDPRINPMHTMVHPQKPGFGGKCLVKDLQAIISASEEAGYSPDLLKQVYDSNKRFRGDDDE